MSASLCDHSAMKHTHPPLWNTHRPTHKHAHMHTYYIHRDIHTYTYIHTYIHTIIHTYSTTTLKTKHHQSMHSRLLKPIYYEAYVSLTVCMCMLWGWSSCKKGRDFARVFLFVPHALPWGSYTDDTIKGDGGGIGSLTTGYTNYYV